jgi:leucyl-tRNA synthetase
MNGLLHLGHAFSLSKLEFAAAYKRLTGHAVLFPQGFHCTGMPIKACADRLAAEVAAYGDPPVFPMEDAGEDHASTVVDADAAAAEAVSAAADRDPAKFAGKKSKAAAKTGAGASQWEIMRLSGLADEEISAFRDPAHWLAHFPPLAARDMAAMGCGVDWRRSFLTTDANPVYDAFVAWQMRALKAAGKIVKDKRLAVFSPLDGQPCADHDRASGEGVGPQEYTLIKLKALATPPALAAACEGKGPVYFLAATLRPETMYGQTNAWVLPTGEYGAYVGTEAGREGGEPCVYVMAARAARSLAWQDGLPGPPPPGKRAVPALATVSGAALLGTPVAAPRSPHGSVHLLPLLTIAMNKGTGVVTSVPSDSPDDWAALRDLQTKPALRAKFGLADEWVLPFTPIPIIDIPGYGDLAAVKACDDLGVASQNDAKKLADAKAAVYLKGFTDGVLTVGEHAGRKVCDVKAVIRSELLSSRDALPYSEPERPVTSRSGDDCVVALTDQWYLTYGEGEWEAATRDALAAMDTFSPEVRHAFQHTLGWLRQWACSRAFGLGTRLPWDPAYLVESLSDSTAYMAFYTVAHLLQGGDLYGGGPGGPARLPGVQAATTSPPVPAAALTDAFWEAVFRGGPDPTPDQCPGLPPGLVAACRREFEFWYPMDLRVSGKDLINNHLTFCLYTHTALWPADPSKWPLAMRCNGHLLLNAEKMSKSTGNFKTLEQAIAEYGADAMRVALADAGDALDDANFEHSTANGAILRLTRELAWAEEAMAAVAAFKKDGGGGGGGTGATSREVIVRGGPLTFADRAFANEVAIAADAAKAAYDRLLFREALKAAMYDLGAARDAWRVACGTAGLHADLIEPYLDVSARTLAPIAPHTMDHLWRTILGRPGTVLTAGWPATAAPDYVLRRAVGVLEETAGALRAGVRKASAPPKAKKGAPPPPTPPKVTGAVIYVSPAYSGWHAPLLAALAAHFDDATRAWTPDAKAALAAGAAAAAEPFVAAGGPPGDKALKQAVIPFAKVVMDEAVKGGAALLAPSLPFDEAGLYEENAGWLAAGAGLGVGAVRVVRGDPPAGSAGGAALPGKPALRYEAAEGEAAA